MKQTSLSFALLLLAIACDGPSRMRTASNYASLGSVGTTTTTGTATGGTTTGTTTTGTTTTGGTTAVTAGFESCNTTASYSHSGIGNISICQSSSNELHFRMGFTTTDQSDGTCLVPLYKDGSGNSSYLGSAQCIKHNAGQVSYGFLQKTRAGYTGYPVNGVMVIKYSGTTPFFQCMQAYDINYQSCRVATCQSAYGYNAVLYNQCLASLITSCDTSAKTYMSNVCSTFKSSYPYIDIRTK